MYAECDEIAKTICDTCKDQIRSFDEAVTVTRRLMPDESTTVIDNVAHSLYELSKTSR